MSMACRTSLQASIATVLSTIILGGGHWLITSCICMPVFGLFSFALLGGRNDPLMRAVKKLGEYGLKFQAGITPPFVIAFNSYSYREMEREFGRGRDYWEFVAFSVLGLFLWTIACVILWFGILAPSFRRMMRRDELETN
jgi:hypothetical protein